MLVLFYSVLEFCQNSAAKVEEEQREEHMTNTRENIKKAIRELFSDFAKVRLDLQISEGIGLHVTTFPKTIIGLQIKQPWANPL